MATSAASGSGSQKNATPKEIQVIENLLRDMGVEEWEPGVVTSLYNWIQFYLSSNLEDAHIYAQHARKKQIDVDDVKLALKMNSDKMFTNPPPRELMIELAKTLNNKPLPNIKALNGPRLPPDRYCLTAPNYSLRSYKKPQTPGMSSGMGYPGLSSRSSSLHTPGARQTMPPLPAASSPYILKQTGGLKRKHET